MFYTKYRPKNFSQVIGNRSVVSALQKSLKEGTLSHALLFYGPRGTGKTSLARIVAKSLVCENFSKKGDACLTCKSCKAVDEGRYADLIELDAASNNSVENIRFINDRINLSPTHGKAKFYIIDEVHMLSKGAFNALLKTLEEPPKNTYFVLATTEPEKVIDTIKSRCQQFAIKRAKNEDIVEKLSLICKEEKFDLPKKDLLRIAQASRGGFRDAETLLEQVIIGGLSVDEVLDTVGDDFTYRFFEALLNKDLQSGIELINEVNAKGKNLEQWNKEILNYLRQIMFFRSGALDLITLEQELMPLVKDQALRFTNNSLLKALKAFNQSMEAIKYAVYPTLPLETASLEFIDSLGGGSSTQTEPAPKSPKEPLVKNSKPEPFEDLPYVDDSSLPDNSSDTSKDSTILDSSSSVVSNFTEEELVEKADSEPVLASSPSVKNVSEELETEQKQESASVAVKDFNWQDFVKVVSDKKPSLSVVLNGCKYKGLQGDSLLLEALYPFHKERLDIPVNRTFLESVLKDFAGISLKVVCVLSKRTKHKGLTDKNVEYVTVSAQELEMSVSSKETEPRYNEDFIPSNPRELKKFKEEQKRKISENPVDEFSGDFEV